MGRSDERTSVMPPRLGCSQSFLRSRAGPRARALVLAWLPSRVSLGGLPGCLQAEGDPRP